ncbi:Ger(x)C family spore germination protein [Virgibacillus sp. C22-A2]|uniref:Ger(X)C family spore germination protein n=1 Tax=Virgibacillus tibetensis TaxID=3042313 RepID=A0ABU6KK18_9BACI|nr:Ger(x)C family spore germination protein [Virgibacillus sp. C22-A2]
MGKSRGICLLLTLGLLMPLTSCWDRMEIEERGFAVGSAIDLVEKLDNGEYKIMLTTQFVVPAGMSASTQSGGGNQEPFMNLSVSGESVFDISREMSKLASREAYYPHLKVIIISEEVVEEPDLFASIMDVFLRDHEMRRSVKLSISKGEAKEVLYIKPDNEDLPAMYIKSVMENSYKTGGSIEPIHIGEVQEYLLSNRSYVIPSVFVAGDNIKYEGVGVFQGKNNQMLEILNNDETKGLGFIIEKIKGGTIKVEVGGDLITIELADIKSNIKVEGKDKENLKISVKMELEGKIAETFGNKSVLDRNYFTKIEEAAAKKVEELAQQTIEKVQGELKVDVLGISDLLYQRHYDMWQTIEGDWDQGANYFSQSTINVSADVKIEKPGATDNINSNQNGDQ